LDFRNAADTQNYDDFDLETHVVDETPMGKPRAANRSITSPVHSSDSPKLGDDQETQAMDSRILDFDAEDTQDVSAVHGPIVPATLEVHDTSHDQHEEIPPTLEMQDEQFEEKQTDEMQQQEEDEKKKEEEKNRTREERVKAIEDRQKREKIHEEQKKNEEAQMQREDDSERTQENDNEPLPSPPLNISDQQIEENKDQEEQQQENATEQPEEDVNMQDERKEEKGDNDSQDTDIETDLDELDEMENEDEKMKENDLAPSPPLNTSDVLEDEEILSPVFQDNPSSPTREDDTPEIDGTPPLHSSPQAAIEEDTDEKSLIFDEKPEEEINSPPAITEDDDVIAETLNAGDIIDEIPDIETQQIEEEPQRKRRKIEEEPHPNKSPIIHLEEPNEEVNSTQQLEESEEIPSQSSQSKKSRRRVSRKQKEQPPTTGSPPKRSKKRKRSETQEDAGSPSGNNKSRYSKPTILFTGKPVTKQQRTIIEKLGGSLVEDHNIKELMLRNRITHLVTDKIRRTFKFLCALSKCPFILNEDWITASGKAKHFLNEDSYILNDTETEEKLQISFNQSLERRKELQEKNVQLFQNMSFWITPNVKPPAIEMQAIIECSGGTVIHSLSSLKSEVGRCNNADEQLLKLLIITCAEDVDYCFEKIIPVFMSNDIDEKQAKSYFYEAEFVLASVMQYQVDISEHKFDFEAEPTQQSAPSPPTRGKGKAKATATKKKTSSRK
jgi:hypothetical protein